MAKATLTRFSLLRSSSPHFPTLMQMVRVKGYHKGVLSVVCTNLELKLGKCTGSASSFFLMTIQ